MNTHLSALVNEVFEALEAKDKDAVINLFHNESEFIDPHYPNTHMKGKSEIIEGLTWSFKGIKAFSFTPVNYFENKHGTHASVEMATKIELENGKKISFRQVFVIETNNGKISRCQAYETYGPHGILKIILTFTRFINKLRLSKVVI